MSGGKIFTCQPVRAGGEFFSGESFGLRKEPAAAPNFQH
jgi:hypothetical protein